MNVITTVPNVSYNVYTIKDELIEVHNPSGLPDIMAIDRIEEPYIRASIITRTDYIGQIMTLFWGKRKCKKFKELIPLQLFDIAVQATIGAKIISRETIKAVRKDVTAKCYGGDILRKRKLLEKQKKDKKCMKQIGNVEVPQKAFLKVLILVFIQAQYSKMEINSKIPTGIKIKEKIKILEIFCSCAVIL